MAISSAHLGFLTAALNLKCTSLVKNTSRRVNNLQYGSAVFNCSDGSKTGAYGEPHSLSSTPKHLMKGNKMNTVEDDFKSGVLKTPNFFCGQVKTDASQNGDVKNITLSLSSVFSDI